MGSSRYDMDSLTSYSKSVSSKPRAAIFSSSSLDDSLNPAKFPFRESVDSSFNPNSTPIMIFVDVTGSMGHLAEKIVKGKLEGIVKELYDKKPITDPHILLGATGDSTCDRAPIQATQFEADVKITEQIEKIWLEGGGGGNQGESYTLAWAFAAYKTKCDIIDKRGLKGYLFTIGDENYLPTIKKEDIKTFLDIDIQADISSKELYDLVSENWNVFHLITETGSTKHQRAIESWTSLMGDHAVVIQDIEALSEVIVSLIQVTEGMDHKDVIASWGDKETGLVVASAIKDVKALTKNSKMAMEQI